jgi:hypothetical protein
MIEAAAMARLVTATSVALRAAARFPSTILDAVNVAAIAMAADQHLDPAALAQEQPRRRSTGLVVVTIAASMRGRRLVPWTQSLPGAMVPLHSCSGTV